MTTQMCMSCGATETTMDKWNGRHRGHWYQKKEGRICHRCYMRIYVSPRFQEKRHLHLHEHGIKFKGQLKYVKDIIVRTGVCQVCGRSKLRGEIKKLVLHHVEYDPVNPIKHTIEVCQSCHLKLHTGSMELKVMVN